MYPKFGVAGVVLAAAISVTSPAFAGASDYSFEPVKAEVKKRQRRDACSTSCP
jgi:hypothetical protein